MPYVWLWTSELATGMRVAAVAAHAFGVLACVTATEAVDRLRGLPRHLAVGRNPAWAWHGLALVLTPIFAGACLLAALPLLALHSLATLVVAVALAVGLTAACLPNGVKYLLVPEMLASLGIVVLPAIALELFAGASVDRLTVVAGGAFLASLVFACHLRDLEADLEADVPTLATRRPGTAQWWLWTAALVGAVAAASGLYVPLEAWEAAALFGAGAFLACCLLPRHTTRVPALTAAHLVFSASLLLR